MANSILYKLSEARTYFIRGHGQWLTYPISIINFISISFYLLIDNLTIIPEELKLLRYWIILFISTYFPLAIIIGYFDMKKGTYRVEQRMAKNLSPIWVEVFEKLDNLDNQQKEIMSKL
jgi:hypothetical protein